MPRSANALRRNRVRPSLQVLDERAVPATLVDLTTHGAEETANRAIFRQVDPQPTGTGVIRSFVRIQGTGVERGYNTDARPLQLNENKSPQFTRSITIGDVPVVVVDGVAYREFLLDINQAGSKPLLSLDELRLYVGTAPNLTGYNATSKTLAGLAPVYDLDSAGNVTVKMNYRLNPGSGGGDVAVLIPDAVFAGRSITDYVYLYSKFGCTWGANAGFEEWAVRKGPAVAPPPALASLSGYVYFDNDMSWDRNAGDIPLEGILITLDGTNNLGQHVYLTTTTDANGYYAFTGLLPGSYSIFETEPTGVSPDGTNFYDGINTIGSLGGTDQSLDVYTTPWTPDGIVDITVGAGDQGIDYNFGEWSTSMVKPR
jgi:SdrD B-like domain